MLKTNIVYLQKQKTVYHVCFSSQWDFRKINMNVFPTGLHASCPEFLTSCLASERSAMRSKVWGWCRENPFFLRWFFLSTNWQWKRGWKVGDENVKGAMRTNPSEESTLSDLWFRWLHTGFFPRIEQKRFTERSLVCPFVLDFHFLLSSKGILKEKRTVE